MAAASRNGSTWRRRRLAALLVAVALLGYPGYAGAVVIYGLVNHFTTTTFTFKAYFSLDPLVEPQGWAAGYDDLWDTLGQQRATTTGKQAAVQHTFFQFTDAVNTCVTATANMYRFVATSYGNTFTTCDGYSWSSVSSVSKSIDTCPTPLEHPSDFFHTHQDLSLNFSADGPGSGVGFVGYLWTSNARINNDPNLEGYTEGCFKINWTN
jgi:hypothetical protein